MKIDYHRHFTHPIVNTLSYHTMAHTPKHVLIAGLGRYVSAAYEVGGKLGIQKTNRQIVLDVRSPQVLAIVEV
jgi:hypothetical protein